MREIRNIRNKVSKIEEMTKTEKQRNLKIKISSPLRVISTEVHKTISKNKKLD